MTINYGWFAYLKDNAPLTNAISSSLLQLGSSLSVTAKKGLYDETRFLGNNPSTYMSADFKGEHITVTKYSDSTRIYNTGLTEDEPHSIKIITGINPDTSNPGLHFIVDGKSKGWTDVSGVEVELWTINALLSATSSAKNGRISRATVVNHLGEVIADWDGNRVLNAQGDDFILRTDANADPLSAQSNFEYVMYDVTSAAGNHINLPASTTWEYVSATVLPGVVYTGTTNTFVTPPGFVVTDVIFGDYSVPFTKDTPNRTGTFDAPALGTNTQFMPFGTVEVTLVDAVNGTESKGTTEWRPTPPYVYDTLRGDPDTTVMSNAYYNWQDPPVRTNQYVYNPTNYAISQSGEDADPLFAYFGRLEIHPDAPQSFADNEYVIDEGGIQEFERNSSPAAIIGEKPSMTLNGPSTVTITQGDSYTDLGATWEDAEDGTGTVYSATKIDSATPAGTYSQVYRYKDADNNSVSRTRTIIVEPAQVQISSTLTVNFPGIPDGTYETYVINADATQILYAGDKAWSDETAAFTFDDLPAGTNCVTTSLGVANGTVDRGVTV